MSLKLALEKLLGAPCYHMVENFKRGDFATWIDAAHGKAIDWRKFYDGYAATVDWPSAAFWPEISAAFPDAVIVLSTRSSGEAWHKSAMDTIFARIAEAPPPMREMFDAMLSRFTRDVRDRDAAIAAYERHNANVRGTAPRGRLVDWQPSDGWAPLCAALRLPVPSEPFPHVNTTDEFRARFTSGQPPTAH